MSPRVFGLRMLPHSLSEVGKQAARVASILLLPREGDLACCENMRVWRRFGGECSMLKREVRSMPSRFRKGLSSVARSVPATVHANPARLCLRQSRGRRYAKGTVLCLGEAVGVLPVGAPSVASQGKESAWSRLMLTSVLTVRAEIALRAFSRRDSCDYLTIERQIRGI